MISHWCLITIKHNLRVVVTGTSDVLVDVVTDVYVLIDVETLTSVVRNVLIAVVGTKLMIVRSKV